MRIGRTFYTGYRQLRRRWAALRTRLRQQGASIALVVLLSLSLGEPLLCIVHCQLWIPFAYQSYFATQHPHEHHAHMVHSGPTLAVEPLAQAIGTLPAGAVAPTTGPTCFMGCAVSDSTGAPFHVPPSPVHDIVPTLMAAIVFLLIVRVRPAAAPCNPPNVPHPLQLRPPILFAV